MIPATFTVFAENADLSKHIVRPKNHFIAFLDPNCPPETGWSPYWLKAPELGGDILVVPGFDGLEAKVRFESDMSILLSLIDYWLSDKRSLDLNQDGIVNLYDVEAFWSREG